MIESVEQRHVPTTGTVPHYSWQLDGSRPQQVISGKGSSRKGGEGGVNVYNSLREKKTISALAWLKVGPGMRGSSQGSASGPSTPLLVLLGTD